MKKYLTLLIVCLSMASPQVALSEAGRLIVGGRDICTGTLVSPSLVLTSGHCVMVEGEQKRLSPTDISFLVKSRHDGERRIFKAIDIGLPPTYLHRNRMNPGITDLQDDIAMLKLDGIATRSRVAPLGAPSDQDSTAFIHKSIGPDRTPSGKEECEAAHLDNDLIVLSCYREHGFSGSPVIQSGATGATIIGVVAANTVRAGEKIIYAVPPIDPIQKVVWLNDLATHQTLDIIQRQSNPSSSRTANHSQETPPPSAPDR